MAREYLWWRGVVKYDQRNALGGTDTTTTAIPVANVVNVRVFAYGGRDVVDLSTSFSGIPPLNIVVVRGGDGTDILKSPPSGEVTDTGYHQLNGDDNDDFLLGGVDTDVLYGGSGSDRIVGNDAGDIIDGGPDDDLNLDGGPGTDFVWGSDGDDTLKGGADDDVLYGGADADTFDGGAGEDTTFSNTSLTDKDQPYSGTPEMPNVPDMLDSGGANCDVEDGHFECADRLVAHIDGYLVVINTPSEQSASGVLGNDEGQGTLTAELVTDVAHGALTLNSNGSFSYEPDEGWYGTDSFEYRVDNGSAESNVATVTLIVTYEAPFAEDDAYGGPADETLEVTAEGVLDNDAGGAGTLTAELFLEPMHGSVTLNSDGTFEYEPEEEFTGFDEFYYLVSDDIGAGTIGRVQVAIYGDVPLPGEDSHTTPVGDELIVEAPGVLGNDYGEGTLTVTLVDDVDNGMLTLNSDGSFEYEGYYSYTGPDSFTYTTTNGTETSDPITVSLFVYAEEPPVAVDDDEEGMYSLGETPPGVLANDSPYGSLTAILIEGPAHGTLDFYDHGGYVYTPDPEFYGTDTFTYIATDGYWLSNIATMTLTIYEPVELDRPANPAGAAALEAQQLEAMTQAAIERWVSAGVSGQVLSDRLAGVQFVIADLPRSALGGFANDTIVIDRDAAGHGWFVDATPGDDREFARQTFASERVSLAGSPANGQVDLLTVLQHEIGHLLGLDHGAEAGNVMQHTLSLSTRRWATAVDAAIVQLLYEAGERERGLSHTVAHPAACAKTSQAVPVSCSLCGGAADFPRSMGRRLSTSIPAGARGLSPEFPTGCDSRCSITPRSRRQPVKDGDGTRGMVFANGGGHRGRAARRNLLGAKSHGLHRPARTHFPYHRRNLHEVFDFSRLVSVADCFCPRCAPLRDQLGSGAESRRRTPGRRR